MKLPKSVETLLIAVLPLVGVGILSVIAIPFGISQISSIRDKISQANLSQNILNQKLSTLSDLSSINLQPDVLTIAMPDSNPSLVTLSQIKILSSTNSIGISGIKGGIETKDKTGLSSVDISFDAAGPRTQILAFMAGINTISPITAITKLKINESSGTMVANITTRSFWAALPTKIPAVTDPEQDLTADEKNIITKTSALKQPVFSEIPASGVAGRPDPFNP